MKKENSSRPGLGYACFICLHKKTFKRPLLLNPYLDLLITASCLIIEILLTGLETTIGAQREKPPTIFMHCSIAFILSVAYLYRL